LYDVVNNARIEISFQWNKKKESCVDKHLARQRSVAAIDRGREWKLFRPICAFENPKWMELFEVDKIAISTMRLSPEKCSKGSINGFPVRTKNPLFKATCRLHDLSDSRAMEIYSLRHHYLEASATDGDFKAIIAAAVSRVCCSHYQSLAGYVLHLDGQRKWSLC
jgi:hypothetical protein